VYLNTAFDKTVFLHTVPGSCKLKKILCVKNVTIFIFMITGSVSKYFQKLYFIKGAVKIPDLYNRMKNILPGYTHPAGIDPESVLHRG
jgi:hypothetical protein